VSCLVSKQEEKEGERAVPPASITSLLFYQDGNSFPRNPPNRRILSFYWLAYGDMVILPIAKTEKIMEQHHRNWNGAIVIHYPE
jgi:hypothetical protein